MNKKQKQDIALDKTYIKIIFKSDISRGSLILKTKFAALNIKKIVKLLKDCEWHIIEDYKLNLEETLSFNQDYQDCLKHLKQLERYLAFATTYNDYESVNHYVEEIGKYKNQLKEIKDRIIKERG